MRIGIMVSLLALFMASPVLGSEERLTNEQVIEMVGAGFSKGLVIKKIESSNGIFDDSPAALIKLKKSDVPEEIIELMLDMSEKRRKGLRSKINLEIQHLTKDNRPETRDAAFMYLYQLGPAALPELRKRLGHSRPEVRAAVAETLGRMQDKQSAGEIRLMLVDSVPAVRHAAAEALGLIKDDIALKLGRQAVVAGTPPLSGYIHLLGKRKDSGSVSIISVRLMENPDNQTRAESAWALGEIGAKKAAKELKHALIKDRTSEVRAQAATALGKLKVPDTAKSLEQLCKNDSSPARAAALRALGEFPAKIAVSFLIQGALLQNKTKLNADELTSVLASLRKLTHQDLGNDPKRWQLWWRKNRELIESGKEPGTDNSFVPSHKETGKSSSPPMPPPPPAVKLPAKEHKDRLAPVVRTNSNEGGGVMPRHATKPGPLPKKETPPISSQDLPDMPPPILPPLPQKQGVKPKNDKGKASVAPSGLTAPPVDKAEEAGKAKAKAKAKGNQKSNSKTPGNEPPGIFVPDRKQQGLAPEPENPGAKQQVAQAVREDIVEPINSVPPTNERDAIMADAHERMEAIKSVAAKGNAVSGDNTPPATEHVEVIPGIVEISQSFTPPAPSPTPARRKRILLATSDDKPVAPDKERGNTDKTHSAAKKIKPEAPVTLPLPAPKKQDESAQLLAREVAAMQGDRPDAAAGRNHVSGNPVAKPQTGAKKKKVFWRSIFRKRPAPERRDRSKARFSADDYDQD